VFVFLFGGMGLTISYLLYWWTVAMDVVDARFWVAGFFCVPPILVGLLGFIQAVSRVPFTKVPKSWRNLRLSQRILIASFTFALLYPLTVYIYFLATLTTTVHANNSAL
jgi:hypothetical protein